MISDHTLLISLFVLLAAAIGLLAVLIYLVLSDRRARGASEDDLCDALMESVAEAHRGIEGAIARTDAKLTAGISSLITYSTTEQKRSSDAVERFAGAARGDLERMNATLNKEFLALQSMVDQRLAKVLETNAGAQEALNLKLSAALAEVRGTVDASLEKVRSENAQKLEAMRATVEEKLERTLTDRLSASFRVVDEKLGLVQSGLGEMREMAQSVSRLQNVLANVKTRGTFGEVRLAAILSEILTPAQYAAQARLDPKSAEAVDFAVKLPGRSDDQPCWLPIDSKFPLEDWELLENAERAGDAAGAAEARKGLERAILKQAKSIRDKYVKPPVTTEFAVMFLPSEGLYAEVLRSPGLFERLQREFRITPAGPTVIAALLNSLLMGFMTLAMERRSSEVWKILAEVKTDFAQFSRQFEVVEKKFREAQNSLDQMSVKSRRMGARMQAIDSLADPEPHREASVRFEGMNEAPESSSNAPQPFVEKVEMPALTTRTYGLADAPEGPKAQA